MIIAAEPDLVSYLPIVTSLIALSFSVVLFRHWRKEPQARHMLWWTIGVAMYGVGVLAEALTTLYGWNEIVFRAWYISGALLGGAPLAQGTVYLLFKRKTADRLAAALISYVAIAATFVILTPIKLAAVEEHRLSGKVMAWVWVRAFSPFVNLYAFIFLVGGAALSAWRYHRKSSSRERMWGNVFIAIGALLPGIGGSFARFGKVEVAYATELIGLVLIWLGYRVMIGDTTPSIHAAQADPAATSG